MTTTLASLQRTMRRVVKVIGMLICEYMKSISGFDKSDGRAGDSATFVSRPAVTFTD